MSNNTYAAPSVFEKNDNESFFEKFEEEQLQNRKYNFLISKLCVSGEALNALQEGMYSQYIFIEDLEPPRDQDDVPSTNKKDYRAPYCLIEKAINAKSPSFNSRDLAHIYKDILNNEKRLELLNTNNAVLLIKKHPQLIRNYLKKRIAGAFAENYRIVARLFISLVLTKSLRKVDASIALRLFELLPLCEICNLGAHPLVDNELNDWLNSRPIKMRIGHKVRLSNIKFYQRISRVYKPSPNQLTIILSTYWQRELSSESCAELLALLPETQQIRIIKKLPSDKAFAALKFIDSDNVNQALQGFKNTGIKRLSKKIRSCLEETNGDFYKGQNNLTATHVKNSLYLLGYLSVKDPLCCDTRDSRRAFVNERNIFHFINLGIPLKTLLSLNSLNVLCKLMIGTHHKSEVQCLSLLGSSFFRFAKQLQDANKKRTGKIDRFTYLRDMQFINNAFKHRREVANILCAQPVLDLKRVIDALHHPSVHSAYLSTHYKERSDIISMLLDHGDTLYSMMIIDYLEDVHDEPDLHEYLLKITRNYNTSRSSLVNFSAKEKFSRLEDKLAQENINIIGDSRELKETGKYLRNCVGTSSYVHAGKQGDVFLRYKNIHAEKACKRGFIAHISKDLSNVYQVKGFANRDINEIETSVLQNALSALRGDQ